jgi:hypothetical protein
LHFERDLTKAKKTIGEEETAERDSVIFDAFLKNVQVEERKSVINNRVMRMKRTSSVGSNGSGIMQRTKSTGSDGGFDQDTIKSAVADRRRNTQVLGRLALDRREKFRQNINKNIQERNQYVDVSNMGQQDDISIGNINDISSIKNVSDEGAASDVTLTLSPISMVIRDIDLDASSTLVNLVGKISPRKDNKLNRSMMLGKSREDTVAMDRDGRTTFVAYNPNDFGLDNSPVPSYQGFSPVELSLRTPIDDDDLTPVYKNSDSNTPIDDDSTIIKLMRNDLNTTNLD